jgi:hypothetical protein
MSNEGTDGTAELAINQVYMLPENVRSSMNVTLGAEIRNDGTVESGQFDVHFKLDDRIVYYHIWDSIGPGQSHWEEMEHPPISAGHHTLAVEVDANNQIRENNKQDNFGSIGFQVQEEPGVVTFDPGQGTDVVVKDPSLGYGTRVSEAIDNELNALKDAIVRMWTNYGLGLDLFKERIHFASGQEAQFDPNAVFKGVLKALADKALDSLLSVADVPGLSQLVGVVKAGVEAYYQEKERSEKAMAEHQIVEFVNSLARGIAGPRDRMVQAVDGQRAVVKNAFHQEIGNVEAGPDGSLTGKAAEFILNLQHSVAAFDAQKPSPEDFERGFAEQFATALTSQTSGTLVFPIDLFRLGSGWAPKQTDTAWTLETTSPHADRIADSLKESLGGKKAWELTLPKKIKLKLYSERDDDDPWASGEIHFTTDPNAYEVLAVETSNERGYATSQLKEAWDRPSTKGYALDTVDIRG